MRVGGWLVVGSALLLVTLPAFVGFVEYLSESWASPVDSATRLHIRRAGTGPRVLVLHGLTGSGGYFVNRQAAIGHFDLIAPDLLGFGESPRPSGPYSLDSHTELVRRAIEELGVSVEAPIFVVGHSFGSIVALNLAQQAPELVSGVLAVSLPIFEGQEDAALRLSADSPMAAAVAREDAWAQFSCMFHSIYRVPQLARFFDVPEDVFLDATRHSWTSLSGTLNDAILATDVRALARKVRQPLWFAHGERDTTAAIERVQVLAAEIDAPVFVHPTGGHQVILQDPAWFGKVLQDILQPSAPKN